jgi:5'-nucleotidase
MRGCYTRYHARMRLPAAAIALALFACPVFAADVSLRIVAINDFHGNLEPVRGEGGAVALAATLARLRVGQPNTLFVSSGDLIGASPLPSALAHDEPTLRLFKHLGLIANAIGNHELDGGLAELRRQQALAGFAFVSSNLVDLATGKPAFAPYRIVEIDGVRVAFVGATVHNALTPLEPGDVPGLRLDDEAEALNAQARELRAQGVHALVALLHEGAGAQDAEVPAQGCDSLSGPARAITEKLDPDYGLVLSAHTHALYACQIGGRWLVQGGAKGRFVSVVDLKLERQHGDVVEASARNEKIVPAASADPAVEKLVDEAVAAAAQVARRVVGTLGVDNVSAATRAGTGSDLGVMIANAQARAGAAFGAQFACTNPSSVPRDLVASAGGGKLTYADARAVQPYGNHLKVLKVSGAQLRALLEQQWRDGAAPVWLSCSTQLTYSMSALHRVEALRVQGRTVEDTDQFTLVANSYLARGGQGFSALAKLTPVADAGLDLDAWLAWLAMQSPGQSDR